MNLPRLRGKKKTLAGAGDLICTPFTGHPVKGVFLCVTVTNSNERQSDYEAALLKAKKQRLSKNSEKKDIN